MATSNAATTYLERRVLDFLFKNNSLSFATPGNSIYVGLATAVTSAENSAFTEVNIVSQDANYTRQQVTAANWKQSNTTLAVNAGASDTEIILTDAEALPTTGNDDIVIGQEILTYTGKDGTATADANGAVTSSTNVAVDGNNGTLTVGMVVTGTGITGTVRIATVTNQNNIVLSSAVTVADNTALSFTGVNTLTGVTRGQDGTSAASHTAGATVICDSQRVINDNNIEFSPSSGVATYTVTHAFVADKNFARATVNGAVSSSANVALDGNSGTIAVGDVVTGTGISGLVTVQTVTNQNAIVLSSAQSISDNVVLKFDGSNTLFLGGLDASKALAVGDIFRINAGNLSIELK
jgi:ribosomal 30S subunit maturation factor RimM|tara:strand:- start:269 stop:1324 length:1056 start_codon:yes stop_codon:yes gene_type:complete